MKNINELTKVELALRRLIYAVETKDKQHLNHPFPMGDIFLQHILEDVKEIAIDLKIPLVEITY